MIELLRYCLSFCAIVTACACSEAVTPAAPVNAEATPNLLEKASTSFSDPPFYTTDLPEGARLVTETSAPDCNDAHPTGECDYLDPNGVNHHYYGDLRVKTIDAARLKEGPITALGIGDTNGEVAIVRRVSEFLDGAELRCEDVREEFETGIDTVCEVTIEEGWATMHFYQDRLILVELTSSHYT